MTAETAIFEAWGLWYVTWLLAALWTVKAIKRPSLEREVLYRALTIAGAVLLFGGFERTTHGGYVLWRPPALFAWGCFPVVLAGFAFTWWARLHLGRLWSGSVTRKADHHVVQTGPYRLVRHPIYTGLLLAALATAAAREAVDGWAGTAFLVTGFYVKARLEESFLRAELGPAYDAYAARVGMLVPFTGGHSR